VLIKGRQSNDKPIRIATHIANLTVYPLSNINRYIDIIAKINEDFKPCAVLHGAFIVPENVLSGVITLPKKITVWANHPWNHRQRVAG